MSGESGVSGQQGPEPAPDPSGRYLVGWSIGALGIVYGDIGTQPPIRATRVLQRGLRRGPYRCQRNGSALPHLMVVDRIDLEDISGVRAAGEELCRGRDIGPHGVGHAAGHPPAVAALHCLHRSLSSPRAVY